MKLLIADDEQHIRNGLKNGINWSKMGIEETFTAQDGVAALQICREQQPEIIITDIGMPGLSGLKLAEQVTSLYGVKKVIILSGYSDFEYAQQAIRSGVVNYLLKPVKLDELSRIVQDAIDTLKKEREIRTSFSHFNVRSALEGKLNQKETQESLSAVGMKWGSEAVCGVIHIDTLYETTLSESCVSAIWLDVQTKLKESVCTVPSFFIDDNMIFLISADTEEIRRSYHSKLGNIFKDINRKIQKSYGASVSVGVSARRPSKEIHTLYRQAQKSLKHCFYQGHANCLFYEFLKEEEISSFSQLSFDTAQLLEQISEYRLKQVTELIHILFSLLVEKRCIRPEIAQELCITIKNMMFHAIKENGVDLDGIVENNQNLFHVLPQYDTLDHYERWINDCCYLVLNGLSDLSQKRHSAAVVQAIVIINQSYSANISLKSVAAAIGKSANYFGYIFKQEMDTTFNEYLNGVRIKKAKELLDTSDSKIYEISEKVGFRDYKYFTTVFKKWIGCSPLKYKSDGIDATQEPQETNEWE